MKRIKRINVKDPWGTDVTVTVEVKSKNGRRSREAINRIVSSVSSGVMTHLSDNPQIKTTLDQIRVF